MSPRRRSACASGSRPSVPPRTSRCTSPCTTRAPPRYGGCPAAAGPSAARLAKRRRFAQVDRPVAFLVDDLQGPLVDGEIDRATSWGRSLAASGPQRHPLADDYFGCLAEKIAAWVRLVSPSFASIDET